MPINSFTARPVPPDTLRAARSSFGQRTFYMLVGDQLAVLLDGRKQQSPPACQLTSLSLITIFQYLENLSDLQAVEATRTRVDWKYALHLPLNYPGFAAQKLCRERYRLQELIHDQQYFQGLITRLVEVNQVGSGMQWPQGGSELVKAVCTLSRLEVVREAIWQVFEVLASRHADWLREAALPHWYERYTPAASWKMQFGGADQATCAALLGADIQYLLEMIELHGSPAMAGLDEVQNMERIYNQQYEEPRGSPRWRSARCATCGDGGLYQ